MDYKPIKLTPEEHLKIAETGELNLQKRNIHSFLQIQIPPIVTKLDLSDNVLTDFSDFNPPSSLSTIILDNNPLVSFFMFPENSQITNFSAKNSYLSKLPNFRSLAILVVGSNLNIINGKSIDAKEKKALSNEVLSIFFHQRQFPTNKKGNYHERLSSILRRGLIFDSLPRHLEKLEEDSINLENEPVTVRCARLFEMIHEKPESYSEFFHTIFAPQHKKVPKTSHQRDLERQLEKQQRLISMMSIELDEIKAKVEQRQDQSKKENLESKLSRETLEAYQMMLGHYGEDLVSNSEFMSVRQTFDQEKVRNIVIKIVGADPSISNEELAQIFRDWTP